MKSGASDPFADESEEADETPVGEELQEDVEGPQGDREETTDELAESTSGGTAQSSPDVETGGRSSGGGGNEDGGRSGVESESRSGASGETSADGTTSDLERSQIPYTLRRNNVKDERPHVHQLFVTDDTDTAAREVERDLEDLLGTDVYRLDAREAIYRIGMQHPEEVAELLEEWGYNF